MPEHLTIGNGLRDEGGEPVSTSTAGSYDSPAATANLPAIPHGTASIGDTVFLGPADDDKCLVVVGLSVSQDNSVPPSSNHSFELSNPGPDLTTVQLIDDDDIELLAKLDEANRALENDLKSLVTNNLTPSPGPSSSSPLGSGSRTSSQASISFPTPNGTQANLGVDNKPSKSSPPTLPAVADDRCHRSVDKPSAPTISTEEQLSRDTGSDRGAPAAVIRDASDSKSSSSSKFSFPSYLFSTHPKSGSKKPSVPNGGAASRPTSRSEEFVGGNGCRDDELRHLNGNGGGGGAGGDDGLSGDPTDSWATWSSILTEWDSQTSKNPAFIKDLVYRGIPQPFRAMAWQLMSGAIPSSPCTSPNVIKSAIYAEYLKRSSRYEKLIRRDINRTYPEHTFFKEKDSAGQESLFNVMKAYSLYDEEVGYCQGSCFIVGLLLMQMPEEEAFAVLIKIMHKYNLRKLFKPSMSELALCMYQLECLIQEYIPDLYHHFQANNFHTSMYASPWFLTLFSSTLPLETAFRIMDVFLIEGIHIIFRISAALLFLSRADLLVLDMEGMLQYIQKEMPARLGDDPDVILNLASNNVPFKEKQMKKVEKEFSTLKAKENEELIQIKKLRQESRLLKQRVQYLEQESASLADRLIQGQVSRAVQAEEQFSIKRDFSELRKVLDDKDHTLRLALEQIRILKEQDVEKGNFLSEREKYEELVVTLQQELLAIKYREAECSSALANLRRKYDMLDSEHRSLKMSDNHTQELNEKMALAKLREAEYLTAIRELRVKVTDLESQWQQYLVWADTDSTKPDPKSSNPHDGHCKINGFNDDESSPQPVCQLMELQNALCKKDKKYFREMLDLLMQLKIAETMSFAELKNLKMREVDMRNELSGKQEKNEVLTQNLMHYKEKFEEYSAREEDFKNKIKSMQCELLDFRTQVREKDISLKLKETELMEKGFEFEAAIMRLETERQENFLNTSLMDGQNGMRHKKISTDSSISSFSECDQESLTLDNVGKGSLDESNKLKNQAANTSDLTDTDSSSLVSFEESLFKNKLQKDKPPLECSD